jgi:peroxiredoxin
MTDNRHSAPSIQEFPIVNRNLLAVWIVGVTVLVAHGRAAEPLPAQVTVLARQNTISIDRALVDGQQLWVPQANVEAITGFDLKPQGLCAGEICIPIPAAGGWVSQYGGRTYFNVTRFAQKVDQVFACDLDHKIWSFSVVPGPQTSPLIAGKAPDFALPDRSGKMVRLSDFRGKKVLLLTWASWCSCRFDLAGWQPIYLELKNKGFEIIAAAQDTGGPQVTERWYEKAHVTYTALTDAQHTISSLYQMVNVPAGVWIDEAGRIVRSSEVAYSKQQKVMGQTIGDNRYAAGLRDWVEKGPASTYVVAPAKLQPRLALRSASERLADAHFKIGVYFSEHGNRELATRQWQESQKLSPDNWNYHRQDWSFDKSKEMSNWLGKVRKLGTKPYYNPVEFPQTASKKDFGQPTP